MIFVILAVAGLLYLGIYTRFHADDFCMAGDANKLGLLNMLVKWYTTWTGRFTFILGTGLLGLGGPKMAGWMPIVFGVLWLGALIWAFYPLLNKHGWIMPSVWSILAGGVIILVLFQSTPNLFQSFYWQDGLVNYSLPLLGSTIITGFLLRRWNEERSSIPAIFFMFFASFILGGFTEAFSSVQVSFYFLLLFAAFIFSKGKSRKGIVPLLLAGLLGGLAAMVVVIIAPGNLIRIQTSGDNARQMDLVRLVLFSTRNTAHVIGKFLLVKPLWAVTAIIPPFIAGMINYKSSDQSKGGNQWSARNLWAQDWCKGFILILVGMVLLVIAACAPVVFALNAYPDDRTIIIPQYVIVVCAVVMSGLLGWGMGQIFHVQTGKKFQQVATILLALVLITVSCVSLYSTGKQVPEFLSYAASWDQRAEILTQTISSGVQDVTVNGLSARFGVADLNEDPGYWVNQCMAAYYQIPSIRGK